jgi:hypothetical protein
MVWQDIENRLLDCSISHLHVVRGAIGKELEVVGVGGAELRTLLWGKNRQVERVA